MYEELRLKALGEKVPILRDKSVEVLIDLCKTRQPQNILEIGTAVGYSGCHMLNVSPKSQLTTIEKDESRFNEARSNFIKYGFSERVELILGDAIDILPTLTQKFDLIFLDGPKAQYIRYLPYLKNLLAPNGVLVADNIYFRGLVKSQEPIARKKRSIVYNLRKFIKALEDDAELKTEFLDIDDGISISIKQSEK